jgi:cytochrome P450
MQPILFNPFDPEFTASPHAFYARLRETAHGESDRQWHAGVAPAPRAAGETAERLDAAAAREELLRFCSPVATSTLRFAGEEIALGSVVIPKGDMVLVVITAANRDPARFPSPDTLDITRTDNKHLTFGHGTHFCLGAPLARLEGEIALGTLLRRMPDLRLGVAPEALTWRPNLVLRGLAQMPVVF